MAFKTYEQQRAEDVEQLGALIATIPDFPSKGVQFKDIFPIFREPAALKQLVEHFHRYCEHEITERVDVVVGLDARGFLIGPALAILLGAAFVPVRKRGKLPGACINAEYVKEYGKDIFEMQADAIKPGQNIIVVDDLIATGGSAAAAGNLVKQLAGNIIRYLFIVELDFLEGRKKLDAPAYSLLRY
ncbi:phosphoribosyltransferase-like protein [Thamnocephalis sphaerospora]|uniref:adenine phosphoribosyltransferase n=1 Tax=Thamnocephalis sphaerospora TaxID=78915 RepID=A0A4P9XJQ9_9FUNG|nr:phosphoribosyltransferase-like protein [Thamnocephalis sphaerospora]|eukprot:RKP06018.1 phosphoribosyltransferase-like protein [Thamnocephalis sphaerospora]